jgi:hypothetical protein
LAPPALRAAHNAITSGIVRIALHHANKRLIGLANRPDARACQQAEYSDDCALAAM